MIRYTGFFICLLVLIPLLFSELPRSVVWCLINFEKCPALLVYIFQVFLFLCSLLSFGLPQQNPMPFKPQRRKSPLVELQSFLCIVRVTLTGWIAILPLHMSQPIGNRSALQRYVNPLPPCLGATSSTHSLSPVSRGTSPEGACNKICSWTLACLGGLISI